ncbi:type IV pilus modification protein PilV [Aquabacterium sp. A7-Y]|uniref:type IV pilus modification protein PilV n=1 Tax=Aquabacterium sp. A7-Y TaxID=1349605 RepID=UPI00223CD895|nr:type IV pilus modification protein PilV [Aquabacterium sp. A7-Y]MCW7539434.1 type IV pilus modification protein PilV [Aquabacterium sp. A7-Y]
MRHVARAHRQQGAMMIEVLVSLVISAIGLGALIALQSRSYSAEAESYDRTQALLVLEDMVQRINGNRSRWADYASTAFGAESEVGDCDSALLADKDLCEWNQLLVRLLPGARACIETLAASSTGLPGSEVRVTVVWRGTTPTAAPASSCAEEDFEPNPAVRRAVGAVVRIGDLAG